MAARSTAIFEAGSEELTFCGSHTFCKIETNGRWHRHMMAKLQPG